MVPVGCAGLALAYVGCIYFQQHAFLAHAARAQGTVVGNWNTRRKGTDHYTAIFTFADARGKFWRVFEPDYRHRLTPVPTSQVCPVVYNPADPAEAQIEVADLWTDVFDRTRYVCFFGALCAAGGLLDLLTGRFRHQQPLAGDGVRNPTTPAAP